MLLCIMMLMLVCCCRCYWCSPFIYSLRSRLSFCVCCLRSILNKISGNYRNQKPNRREKEGTFIWMNELFKSDDIFVRLLWLLLTHLLMIIVIATTPATNCVYFFTILSATSHALPERHRQQWVAFSVRLRGRSRKCQSRYLLTKLSQRSVQQMCWSCRNQVDGDSMRHPNDPRIPYLSHNDLLHGIVVIPTARVRRI